MLCPPEYRETDFERLVNEHPQNTVAITHVQHRPYDTRGLVLFGPPGSGKTRSMWGMLQKWHNRGINFAAYSANGFALAVEQNFRDGKGPDWVAGHAQKQALVIDDIDKAKFTERVESEFYAVIEIATSHKIPIVLTTNITGQEFQALFAPNRGPAIARRLREFCKAIKFT